MSGSNIVADTSVLINFFNGVEPAGKTLENQHVWVSVITEMELLSYKYLSTSETRLIRSFLDECTAVELIKPIRNLAIYIRKQHNLKLPDAIISATAIHLDFPLITMDRDFNRVNELNVVLLEQGI